MYEQEWKTYKIRPATKYCIRKSYIDTADTGEDYLCDIIYDETEIGNFVVDVDFTQKPMEYTEPHTAEMFTKHGVIEANIESNNGGRGFARNVEKQCRLMGNTKTKIKWFHQSLNKQERIFSHSADVQNMTYMTEGWEKLFPLFYSHITGYMKIGKNAHDDAPDALTGTFEKRKSKGHTDVIRLM